MEIKLISLFNLITLDFYLSGLKQHIENYIVYYANFSREPKSLHNLYAMQNNALITLHLFSVIIYRKKN